MTQRELPIGYSSMSSALPCALNYHRWIMDMIRNWIRGRVVEIGFGYGQYTGWLSELADEVIAVDADRACIDRASAMPANVRLELADLASEAYITTFAGDRRFDGAVCLNVLEHIADDKRALCNLGLSLKPGGRAFLLVPAHQCLFGSLDSLAGHYRRYDMKRMRDLLAAAGLHIVVLRYFNPVGGLGWWVNTKLFEHKDLSHSSVNSQILWYDRYLQPVSRFVDPLTRRFFGQSLLVVAEKPRRTCDAAGRERF